MYYPAASLYKAACLTFNFGPKFAFPPKDVGEYAAVSTLANASVCGDGATGDVDAEDGYLARADGGEAGVDDADTFMDEADGEAGTEQ